MSSVFVMMLKTLRLAPAIVGLALPSYPGLRNVTDGSHDVWFCIMHGPALGRWFHPRFGRSVGNCNLLRHVHRIFCLKTRALTIFIVGRSMIFPLLAVATLNIESLRLLVVALTYLSPRKENLPGFADFCKRVSRVKSRSELWLNSPLRGFFGPVASGAMAA